MGRAKGKLPTDAELEILQVLWDRGPSTVREVHEQLSRAREIGYTTVLKFMQIMTEKGTIDRDTSVRPQIYDASSSQAQMQKQILRSLMDRVFRGSPGNLVLQALSSRKASSEELQQIRELLDQIESKEEHSSTDAGGE